MPIVNRVRELAETRKGIKSILELSEATGLSYRTAFSLWKNQTSRIDYGTLYTLCQYLEVEPGDVLVLSDRKKH